MKDPISTDVSETVKVPEPDALELKSGEFLEVLSEDIIKILSVNNRVLIKAYPGTGKTSLIAQWFADRTNVPFDKIVFMSPLLVIQDQFKSRVEKNDGQIDLELNYKSHQAYKFGNKNITSTFKSLFKIEGHLTEEDLIVVDEAHMLLNAFRKGKLVDVYGATALILRRTRAKILFLSATPGETLKEVFDYKIVSVSSAVSQSNIEFYTTDGNYLNFGVWFAKRALRREGKDKLHIIYYNSKSGITGLKALLEEETGSRCEILSSDAKNTEAYEDVIRTLKIASDIQFLLTTSLISAGASILNDNIGEALIFDNHDPIDLFQFSKRFRNRLDLPITLVNRQTWDEKEYPQKQELKTNILPIRETYNQFLKDLDCVTGEGHLSFNRAYHNDAIGTKKDLLIRTMTRLLIEECQYKERLTERYKDSKELIKVLSLLEFKVTKCHHPKFKEGKVFGEFVKNHKIKTYENNIDKFLNDIDAYLSAIKYYADYDKDYSVREVYAEIENNLNFIHVTDIKKGIEDLEDPFFYSQILMPFLNLYSFFNDSKKTLIFMSKTVDLQKRNKAVLKLHFCSIFNTYFEQGTEYSKPTVKSDFNSKVLSPKENLGIVFIIALLEFIEEKPFYDHLSLSNFLRREVKVSDNDLINHFPFDTIELSDKPSKGAYVIEAINKSFTSCLFEGIIYTDSKRIQPKKYGIPRNPKIPKHDLDDNLPIDKNDVKMWELTEFEIQKRRKISRTYFNTTPLLFHILTQ